MLIFTLAKAEAGLCQVLRINECVGCFTFDAALNIIPSGARLNSSVV